MLNYEPRIYKKNFRSGDLIYGARDYRNEINTIQDKLPYTINIYNDYVFGMFGLSAPLFNTPDKIYNLTITSEMMNVIENPTNQQNIENLKKAISAPYTKSFFNYSGFYIPYSFLDIYLKLLIGDIASKFSVENIAKRFTGMQLLDRQALFLKRLCKLGMEWALINNKHIHFLVPNFFDTKSWDNLFNEKRNKKNQLSLHITTVEIMHLLKHFERYREIVYFYDQITGNELPVSRVEQLFLSKIKNAEKREKLNKIYEDIKQFDKKVEQLSRDNYKNEIYWVKKLQEYYPAQVLIFPKSRYKNVPSIIAYTHTLKTESKNRLKTLCKRHGLHFDKFLLTALLAYIYRINSYECFIYRDKICNKVR